MAKRKPKTTFVPAADLDSFQKKWLSLDVKQTPLQKFLSQYPVEQSLRDLMAEAAKRFGYQSDLFELCRWLFMVRFCAEHRDFPTTADWMHFRPSRETRQSMMRLSVEFPGVFADVRERLDAVNEAFESWERKPSEGTKARYAEALGSHLESGIHTAIQIVANASTSEPLAELKPATPPQPEFDRTPYKLTKTSGRLVDLISSRKRVSFRDAGDEVWGDDLTNPETIERAVVRANKAIEKSPFRITIKAGVLYWE